MVGDGLYMDGDTLNVSISAGGDTYYTIVDGEGVVSLQPVLLEKPYTLPRASRYTKGGVIVTFDAIILNRAVSQRKIVAEYKSESESCVVIYKGTVSTLPEKPKQGCLCYMSANNKFHIYDSLADKWRS